MSDDRGPGESRSMGEALREARNVVVPCWWLAEGPQLPLARWQILYFDSPAAEGAVSPFLGFVNLQEDGDGFVRRQRMIGQAEGQPWPQFALAVQAVAAGQAIRFDARGRPSWEAGRSRRTKGA